ncbi:YD repeat-containing protein, partial [Leeuwenhoekiella aestuarii]|uniref:RHS repeat domain-containing protein n=1 Tax=Leeuwenhoekiella aestuarii TaxID=2249426 RepID=UPI0010276896
MNIRLKSIALFSVLIFLSKLNAQNNNDITSLNPTLENYIPNSPEVAALNKFGEYPVSEATGVPAVNIPVYSYSGNNNGLSLNISLDYHLGGIKLNERTSREGLGWVLNAGGVISRSVRGTYDELSGLGFINHSLPQTSDDGNTPSSVDLRPFNRMYANVQDSQADIFNYNFGGQSGKFILGRNGDILLLNQKKIKIEKFYGQISPVASFQNGINKFIITDEKGVKYHFDKVETTVTTPYDQPNNKFASSWFLSKIESFKSPGKFITFQYEPEYFNAYNISYSNTRYSRIDKQGGERVLSNSSSMDIMSWRIKKISFPNNVAVNFQYSTTSTSFGHLDRITVEDNKSNNRGFILGHDQSLNRLTLKSITPFSDNPFVTERPYKFEYVGSLPNMYTGLPDHWGYYTGRTDVLVPHEIFPNGLGHGIFELPGSNRDTDSLYVKYGSLKKIEYPTGGSTIFDMEANQADDPRLDVEFTSSQYQESEILVNSISQTVDSNVSFGTNVESFQFSGEDNIAHKIKINVGAGYQAANFNPTVTFELHSSTNFYAPPIVRKVINLDQYGGQIEFQTAQLNPGQTYYIHLYTHSQMSNYYAYVNTSISILGDVETVHTYKHKQFYAGGLRVKRIINYDKNQVANVKRYSYLMPDNSSSGSLGVYPKYSYTVYYENREASDRYGGYMYPAPERYLGLSDNVIIRQSNPVQDLGYSNGSPVIYKRVLIETKSGNNSLGKEIKYFTNFNDSPAYIDQFLPYTPTVVDDWKYGLLTKDSIFDSSNNLIKTLENTYQYSQDKYYQNSSRFENFRSVSILPVIFYTGTYHPNPTEIPPLGTPLYFLSESYYPSSGRADLKSTKTTMYFNSGKKVEEMESYIYDPTFFKPKTIITSTSDNKEIVKEFKYSFNLLSSAPFQYLYNKNDVTSILQSKTTSNTTASIERHNEYDFFNTIARLKVLKSKKSSNDFENRIIYHSYDNHGNPLEVSKDEGSHISYLWGYSGEYIVAKIENATQAEVTATGVNQAILTNPSSTNAQRTTELNKVRNGLPNAMVTTYEYEPLVGVTKITDPRGQEMTYEYDDFNRLKTVLDDE